MNSLLTYGVDLQKSHKINWQCPFRNLMMKIYQHFQRQQHVKEKQHLANFNNEEEIFCSLNEKVYLIDIQNYRCSWGPIQIIILEIKLAPYCFLNIYLLRK